MVFSGRGGHRRGSGKIKRPRLKSQGLEKPRNGRKIVAAIKSMRRREKAQKAVLRGDTAVFYATFLSMSNSISGYAGSAKLFPTCPLKSDTFPILT